MGIVSSSKNRHNRYIEKLNEAKSRVSHQMSKLETGNFSHQKMKDNLIIQLDNSFPFKSHQDEEFLAVRNAIKKADSKEIISTFSFIQWEKNFIEIMRSEDNSILFMEIESSRFSKNMLNKQEKNLFWKLVRIFDYYIAKRYKDDMDSLFRECYARPGYKVSFKNSF